MGGTILEGEGVSHPSNVLNKNIYMLRWDFRESQYPAPSENPGATYAALRQIPSARIPNTNKIRFMNAGPNANHRI